MWTVKKPKLIGPPKSASNEYAFNRLKNRCAECEYCDAQWSFVGRRVKGFSQQVNIGGRVMAVRKAMYIAAFPNKKILSDRMISSTCQNPDCINPEKLVQHTRSNLLKSHYEKGIRMPNVAASHLLAAKIKQSKWNDSYILAIRMDARKGAEAASEYGMSPTHYNSIQAGRARVMNSNPFRGLGAR